MTLLGKFFGQILQFPRVAFVMFQHVFQQGVGLVWGVPFSLRMVVIVGVFVIVVMTVMIVFMAMFVMFVVVFIVHKKTPSPYREFRQGDFCL
jgi:hypothetical protein